MWAAVTKCWTFQGLWHYTCWFVTLVTVGHGSLGIHTLIQGSRLFPAGGSAILGAFISSADALRPIIQGEKRRMEESSPTSVWRWQPSRLLALHCRALFPRTHTGKKRRWTFGIKYSGIYHIYTTAIWSLVRYKTICKKCHVSFLHVLLQQTQVTHATPSQPGVASGLGKETPAGGQSQFWGMVPAGQWGTQGSFWSQLEQFNNCLLSSNLVNCALRSYWPVDSWWS